MTNTIKVLIIYSLLLPTLSQANNSLDTYLNFSLEELMQLKVIIASGTEQNINRTPSTVTVITSDDIKNTGATNLTDILESVPGLHININPVGFRPLIHMRGGNSHQTLLMVNGNPMKDLVWAFGIFWKGLPVSIIERVEIIRGPGSVLYGADAITGVVNIITKTAKNIENSEIGMRVGSFNTQTAWFQHNEQWNNFHIGLTADFSKTEGHDPFILADAQTSRDPANSTAPDNANYGWKNNDLRFSLTNKHWKLLANYMKHSDLEIGMTGGGNLDPDTKTNDERYELDLLYNNQNFNKNWGVDTKLHYQDLNYSSGNGFQESPPTATAPDGLINHMRSAERKIVIEVNGLYSGISNHNIRIGSGYSWEDLYSVEQEVNFGTGPDGAQLVTGGSLVDISDTEYTFAPERTRTIQYLTIQDQWKFTDNWELTSGVRYDHYSDFGDTVNPRISLLWDTTSELTTRLMYGEAFRAPSFQELFSDSGRALSNSNLEPEKSKNLELAFSYSPTKIFHLGVNIYKQIIKDNIYRQPISAGSRVKQYQNTGEQKTTGIEIEAKWEATKYLAVSGNYMVRNPEDSDFRVVQEPEQSAYFRSDWRFQPNWNWNIQANWIGDRHRRVSDCRVSGLEQCNPVLAQIGDVKDYVIADTTIRYAGIKQWEFSASIKNIFDKGAREHTGQSVPYDLPLPERNFHVELLYKF